MGCISSKEAKPDRRWRSLSLPVVRSSRRRGADSIHLVSLTFSTLGSLTDLDPNSSQHQIPESETIINAWELMEGLEEEHHHNSSTAPLSPEFPGIVKARVAAFQEKIDAGRRSRRRGAAKGKVVMYTTSLRGVRETYEDCRRARATLESYGVGIDERDVSMDGGFREELREIVGSGGAKLPRVFADGRCLGGAEEVAAMHENGELSEALKGCEMGWRGGGCEGCGDYRFVPCGICAGSCKVFVEGDDDGGGFRRCVSCNENGLVRCPVCC